jgi:hypothetical protein
MRSRSDPSHEAERDSAGGRSCERRRIGGGRQDGQGGAPDLGRGAGQHRLSAMATPSRSDRLREIGWHREADGVASPRRAEWLELATGCVLRASSGVTKTR